MYDVRAHTHTHTHSYLHVQVCVYVYVYACECVHCLFCPLAFALISNCCGALRGSNSNIGSISATDASVVLFVF